MTFRELESLLYPLGLSITDRKWDYNYKGEVILHGKVSAKTENDTPCFHKGASYGDLSGAGHSLDALAEDVWKKMTDPNAQLLLGSYCNYESVIEWKEVEGKFVKRKLTEAEAMEQNTSI